MKKGSNAKKEIIVILDNIRSAENVGSIFRTSDAANVSKIFLTGITPGPVDQFDRPNSKLVKSALGAEKVIPWEKVDNEIGLINGLKEKGFTIIALEQDKKSIDYKKVKNFKKIVLILGSEVNGVSPKLLKLSDIIAEIPMNGIKESLNVSVAFGIAVFSLK